MSFREWRRWLTSKPLCLKWFIFLVLLKTFIDNFYFLKKISPLLSPLYIVGVLTPVLILASYTSRHFPKKKKSPNDKYVMGWGVFVFLNVAVITVFFFSIDTLGNAIRYITPIILYFYLRHFIQSRQDLTGILQTFLYSALVPAMLFPYNYFFNPRAFQQLSESRGGGLRFHGGYADILSYGVLIIGVFLVFGYFYLDNLSKRKIKKITVKFILIIFACVFGMFAIKHTATWAVFLMLLGAIIFYTFRKKRGVLPIIVILAGSVLFAGDFFKSRMDDLVAKEMEVLHGEADIERSFNGRMFRWKKYFTVWSKMPQISWFAGVSFSVVSDKSYEIDGEYFDGFSWSIPAMVSGHMHNDFIRNLFLSGIFGFIFYILFLFSVFKGRNKFNFADRFLILGAILIVGMYSISANPSLYPTLIYYIYAIFAYASLPANRTIGKAQNKRTSVRS